jgi:hypothetical protein
MRPPHPDPRLQNDQVQRIIGYPRRLRVLQMKVVEKEEELQPGAMIARTEFLR